MPGYKPLPVSVIAPGAAETRQAESIFRRGNPADAAQLLEEALDVSQMRTDVLPGWLCGRLAALYRTLERYDDEVALLERYRESQVSEEARTRYDARLTKARAIADRKRTTCDNGALDSVRAILQRPRQRARKQGTGSDRPPCPFSPAVVSALTGALETSADDSPELANAIALLCAEAREHQIPAEEVVAVLRSTTSTMNVRDARGNARYDNALVYVLAQYYEHA